MPDGSLMHAWMPLGFTDRRWSVRFLVFYRISSRFVWLLSTTSSTIGKSKTTGQNSNGAKISLNRFRFDDKESCRVYEEETESQIVCYTKMLQTM